jgi:hypothetical protein
VSSVNKAIILGNLGKDPEKRYTQAGDAVVTLSVATSESWKDASGAKQERTESAGGGVRQIPLQGIEGLRRGEDRDQGVAGQAGPEALHDRDPRARRPLPLGPCEARRGAG